MNSLAALQRIAVSAPADASAFARYAAYYDLLYRDKDYAVEAAYVARTIRAACPAARHILELGSGTGRHGRLLAGMGFDVHGIERSMEMVGIAHAACDDPSTGQPGSFACEAGDLCSARLGRTFDAVIALFHVLSYQATNDQLLAAFRVAAGHLAPGGVFLFDVWHGPAVLSQCPERRIKQVEDARYRVQRAALPELDAETGTVKVVYRFECEDLATGAIERFDEAHVMRYLFPTEVDLLARSCGLTIAGSEEFATGMPPSAATWGVAYVLRN